jgi:hypothetical protein
LVAVESLIALLRASLEARCHRTRYNPDFAGRAKASGVDALTVTKSHKGPMLGKRWVPGEPAQTK